jgi:hypothetical protein
MPINFRSIPGSTCNISLVVIVENNYDLLILVGVYTSIALAAANTAAITSTVFENILNFHQRIIYK